MLRSFVRAKVLHTLAAAVALASLTVVAATTLFAFTPASALTTTPQRINFQGRLTDASGNIVANGLYNMKFALYDAASAGTQKWTEVRETTNRVQVTGGLFTVQLGAVNAFTDPTIFSNGNLYFEITLANPATATCSTASCQTWESPMTRSQLATSAYAFNSDTLDGIDSSGFIQNQTSNTQTADFKINGTGTLTTLNASSSISLGTASTTTGTLALKNSASAFTLTLQSAAQTGNYSLTIPVLGTNDTMCLQTLGNCGGSLVVGTLDGGTANSNGATVSSGTIYLQSATATNAGLVTTSAQTFAGAKTFNDSLALASGQSLTLNGGATRPASPVEGMVYYDTATKQLLTYSNGKWQADSKTATFIVAAYDSPQSAKDGAQYVVTNAEDSVGAGTGTIDGAQIAINNALTAAASAGGGIVYLSQGTYTIDAPISIPNNVTLVGAGAASLVQLGNFGATSVSVKAIVNTDTSTTTGTNVSVRDIRLDGRKSSNTSGTQYGVYFSGVGSGAGTTGANIRGVTIDNFRTDGLYLTSVKYAAITDTMSRSNSGKGMSLSGDYLKVTGVTASGNTSSGLDLGGNNIVISSSQITGNTGNGISTLNAIDAAFTGNSISGNTGNGIDLWGARATVSGNTIKSNAYGVRLYQSANNIVSGNMFEANTIGIYFTTSSDNNTLSGNTIDSSTQQGIYNAGATPSANDLISNNLIRNSGASGAFSAIELTGGASPSSMQTGHTISNNRIIDSAGTGYAINIANSNAGTVLAGNTYSGTGAASINDVGSGTVWSSQLDANGNIVNKGTGSLTVGTSTVNGTLSLQGGLTSAQLATPAAPTITTAGTAGTTSYSYAITALDGTGETLASANGTIATGNATLNSTNYTVVTWNKISGATKYNIYRTASAGTPATTGLIATVTATASATQSLNDTGLAASGTSPTSNTTGGGTFAGALQSATGMSLGTSSAITGTLTLNNSANNRTVTLQSGATASAYTLTLPTTLGNSGDCLKDTTGTGVLGFGSCGGSSGGLSRTITLAPEFAGGILHADGSNNGGTMISDSVSGLVSGQGYKHNFYQWTTTNATTAQDYDIVVNTALPSEYASALGGLKVWSYSTNLTNATGTIQFQSATGTTCYAAPVAITPSAINTWQQITVGVMSGCAFAANDVVTITIHMVALNNASFEVGEVSYTYSN